MYVLPVLSSNRWLNVWILFIFYCRHLMNATQIDDNNNGFKMFTTINSVVVILIKAGSFCSPRKYFNTICSVRNCEFSIDVLIWQKSDLDKRKNYKNFDKKFGFDISLGWANWTSLRIHTIINTRLNFLRMIKLIIIRMKTIDIEMNEWFLILIQSKSVHDCYFRMGSISISNRSMADCW